ncbi:hypothetical protein [uncultured Pseudomonas sp.]|uniref:hypothetical protein n=1 Tax=uncultured Pseudomonas sp. TaxID=114707 RepID=UPI0030DA9A21|tara:strand:- start:769 stop:1140 length:372 start_codon:yes stop_codon:yes gene_type:complete
MKKASIPIHAEASPSHGQNITCPAELLRTAPSKIARVLVYVRHFDSLNRFEAARKVGDTCINSTIPALESQYDLSFEHIPEKAANHWGAPCGVTRYRLPASQHEQADKVLTMMFARKGKKVAA